MENILIAIKHLEKAISNNELEWQADKTEVQEVLKILYKLTGD